MRAYYESGAHLVIVDIGNSYQGLCTLFNGIYFVYQDDRPLSFGPFALTDGLPPDIEKRESLKVLLLTIWKKEDEPVVRSEYVAISTALLLYFDKKPDHPCFNSFYEFVRDEYRQKLVEDGVKQKDFDVDNFLYVLRPYYKGGEYEHLLNASQQIDLLHERLIIFELDQVKDHPILFPVVTIMIMDVFIGKMRKLKGIRKVILIEEAWKAIAKQGMSDYIRYLFKTVRKFYGEAIVVTQEIEDIIGSPVIKNAIINNADCKILLDQSRFLQRFDEIQQLLGLSQMEKTMVLSINRNNETGRKYKEVFIGLGGKWARVYRTEVSLEEYLVYTTEEKEKIKVQEFAKKEVA